MKAGNSQAISILVVEDEPSISLVCRRVLAGQGFTVDTAVNGLVAQGMIEKREYDLYLIDIRIPEMDGRELYNWLKEKKPPLIRRVIFTTGDVMSGGTPAF